MKSRLKTNGIFLQLLWLVVAAIVTFLFAYVVFRWRPPETEITIHFADTYFVVYAPQLLTLIFLGTSFVLFLVKEFRKKFTGTLPNCIILVTGTLLIFFLTGLQRLFPLDESWTLYPPLSALYEKYPIRDEIESSNVPSYMIMGCQLLIVAALLHVAYNWGKSKNKPVP